MAWLFTFLSVWLLASAALAQNASQNGGETRGRHKLEGVTLQSLLNWGIENSDPAVLKKQAEWSKGASMDIETQRKRIRELSELMSMHVTESDLLKVDLPNFVHSIVLEGNHSNLHKIDGIECLVDLLDSKGDLSPLAAHVIGVAASNNPTFQAHLHAAEPEIISKLLKLLEDREEKRIGDGLYALSSLVRNSDNLRTLFYANGGLRWIHHILETTPSSKLKRKCLTLLTDLMQLGDLVIRDFSLMKATVNCFNQCDSKEVDLEEKALLALFAFAQNSENLSVLKTALELGKILEAKRNRILDWMEEHDEKEHFHHFLETVQELLAIVTSFEPSDHTEL